MYATGETLLERSESGTVHLSFDGGVSWVQFRTEAAYRWAMEQAFRTEMGWYPTPRDRALRGEELDRWAEDRIEQDRSNVRSLGVR